MYGKALLNDIDAPKQPKVSHIFEVAAVASGGSSAGDKPSERYTLRQIERKVKSFLRNYAFHKPAGIEAPKVDSARADGLPQGNKTMDFDAALLAHSAWKRKLKAYLEKPDRSLQASEVALDNKCKLGEWITGEGRKHAASPLFKTLTAEHARFHKAAAELVRRANLGENVDEEVALGASSEFAKATAAVVGAIAEMKKNTTDART